MAEAAANLVEHVLPERAPLRQFVLTLPFERRARLAYDGKLLGAVCHAFVDSVLSWYRRHFQARSLSGGKSGAITAVQRVSSDCSNRLAMQKYRRCPVLMLPLR